jgi:AI-2E family transporter
LDARSACFDDRPWLDFYPIHWGRRFGDPEPAARFSVDLDLAVYVILLYLAVHLVESYILVPLVQRRIVRLPPALTLSAQILFGVLAGFLGLLLATPLVAAALAVFRMAYVEDMLGDRFSTSPARCSNPNSLQRANDGGSSTA